MEDEEKNFYLIGNNLYMNMSCRDMSLREAVGVSIEKWETIVTAIQETGQYIHNGHGDTCAMCQINDDECESCPVMRNTGLNNCESTPYIGYIRSSKDPKAALYYAQAEVRFLKRLRDNLDE